MSKEWTKESLISCVDILDNKRKPINSNERQKRIEGKSKNELFPYFGATGQVGYIDDYLVEGEYVLLGEDGAPFLDPVKKKAYLAKGKIWVNNHAHILKGKVEKINDHYLCHFLNNFNYYGYVTGTTRLKLNQGSLKTFPICYPDITTQKKIASKIDTLFAKIDSGTQSLEKAKRLLEQYRQSVLKHAFEGKLTAKWREENKDKREPASVLLERIKEERKKKLGKKYKELPPVDASKLPELPEGWMWCRLGEMCEKVLRRNSEFKKTFYYIDIGSIDNKKNVILNPKKINAKNAPSRAQQIIREGDILFSTVRTYLKNIAIVPLEYDSQICSTGFCVIRPNEYLNNSLLFLYCLKEGFVNNLSKIQRGTSYPACRDDDVMNEIIPVPPLSEQQIVLNKILKMQNYFNRLLNQQTQVLNYKETLKNSILKSAFEGKLIHD